MRLRPRTKSGWLGPETEQGRLGSSRVTPVRAGNRVKTGIKFGEMIGFRWLCPFFLASPLHAVDGSTRNKKSCGLALSQCFPQIRYCAVEQQAAGS